jgi:ribosomal protein S20
MEKGRSTSWLWMIILGLSPPPSMIQQVAQKRKKRLLQLREAQRRRRTRLKEEHKAFLQIILTEDMQAALRNLSVAREIPMHLCAAELIEEGLARHRIEEVSNPTPRIEPSNGPDALSAQDPLGVRPSLER